ncbi:MAG: ABC transporter permease [SAR202 cluster bacterium]|nr:ABC transporter permease [SAR202 cluster bacterium]|tara:strand:- start:571 stop:1416 length:846 start_codon:yes stop_codon:yes gene_type:complete
MPENTLRQILRLTLRDYAIFLLISAFLILCILSILAEVISSHDPLSQHLEDRLSKPDSTYYLGTDGLGRDIFSRVLHGIRTSLVIGFTSLAISSVLGVTIGIYCGMNEGRIDLTVQRIIDVLLAFPFFLFALIFVVALGPSIISLAIAIGLGHIPIIARLSRANTILIKQSLYVEAAQMIGAEDIHIVRVHILPNSFIPILAQLPSNFANAIGTEAALSFFGLGIAKPIPSLGNMMSDGITNFIEVAPWITFFPAITLIVLILTFSAIIDKFQQHTTHLRR